MNQEHLDELRHSSAHLLAAAVQQLWPEAKRTIGPAIENGFYYDFDFGEVKISEDDLPKIEKKMKEILKGWKSFDRHELSEADVRKEFHGNEYKLELIDEFSGEGKTLTVYQSGEFRDLCRGGHSEEPNKDLRNFKLLSLAGAYWRGDEKNKMLTRIYGTCFPTKDELQKYLTMLEEAKKRDHRKLGALLDLFTFSELVGPGLPLFTPKGNTIRRVLDDFVWKLMKPYGYERVWIPHLAKSDLYKTSGHWDKFSDDIFHVKSQKTDTEFVLKPMNCPHHAQIFASRARSYRDLPIRYSEVTTVYRDENTGQLQGLSRVRSITQDDAHIFCEIEQVRQESINIYKIINKFYEAFDMPLRIRLSVHDPEAPEKYLGEPGLWKTAEDMLEELLKEFGQEFERGVGEAAFYGPKIDFMARDAIGREWQLATIQLDFNQPERFGLEYAAADGGKKRPVMIHRAISGSIERFISVLIEHYAGAFPMWIAPVQVRLATVGENFEEAARRILAELVEAGVRAELDDSNESVGKKIRAAAKEKIPWTIVVGEKESSGEAFTVNVFGQEEDLTIPAEELVSEALAAAKMPV